MPCTSHLLNYLSNQLCNRYLFLQQLTHLRAKHSICLGGYQSFLPHFKNLQVLDVSWCKNFNDSCMQILGFHCQHLRYGTCIEMLGFMF